MNNTPHISTGENALQELINSPNIAPQLQQYLQQKIQTMITPQKLISPEAFAKQQQEQKALEQMRIDKKNYIQKYLDLTPEEASNRPDIREIDLDAKGAAELFAARQNLACAFDCCADSDSLSRVEEITSVLNNTIEANTFVHLDRFRKQEESFPKYWNDLKVFDPRYASQYFEVHVLNTPQDAEERKQILEEMREVQKNYKQFHS